MSIVKGKFRKQGAATQPIARDRVNKINLFENNSISIYIFVPSIGIKFVFWFL